MAFSPNTSDNPVTNVDPDGHVFVLALAAPAVVGYAANAIVAVGTIAVGAYCIKGSNRGRGSEQRRQKEELRKDSKKHKQGSGGTHGEGRVKGGKKGRNSRR